jgi:cellulose synthase/poly-beta-1,6-N-acetylglucosamine synthase-like glycosyltransferase
MLDTSKGMVAVFFTISAFWFIMMYYTVVPWILGIPLHMNADLDLSAVTWFSVLLSLTSTLLWFVFQSTYLVVGKKIEKQQALLIRNKRYHNPPLVSILIPAKNEEAVIRRTINSCLAQTYKNIEVLIICHNCTDKTFDLAKSTDSRVRPLEYNTQEAGKGIALNYGVKNAKGEYLLILDSDGILSRDFIANAMPLFDEGFAALQGKISSSNRNYNQITRLLSLEGDMFSTPFMAVRHFFDKRTPLGGTGSILKKEALEKVGGFSNALIEDFELSFRFYRNKYRIGFASLSIVYDEKPGELPLMMRQRSRWVKGHFDLIKKRIPEKTDLVGIIYWLSPLFLTSGFFSILVTSTAILHYVLFETFPFKFTFVPISFWFGVTVASYSLQFVIVLKELGLRKITSAAHIALLVPFSHYWYVCLLKSFFVKSWSTTKTTHGFIRERDIEVLVGDQRRRKSSEMVPLGKK